MFHFAQPRALEWKSFLTELVMAWSGGNYLEVIMTHTFAGNVVVRSTGDFCGQYLIKLHFKI